MKYTVEVKEVWSRTFEVEANSAEEARKLTDQAIEEGKDDKNFEYDRTLSPEDWTVRDDQGNYH